MRKFTASRKLDTELEESDPFTDFEEDANELEENELILQDC